jgi:hypothetical protein
MQKGPLSSSEFRKICTYKYVDTFQRSADSPFPAKSDNKPFLWAFGENASVF